MVDLIHGSFTLITEKYPTCLFSVLTDTNSFDNPFTDHDETSATIVAHTSSGDLTSCQVLEKMAISCAHCMYVYEIQT